MNPGSPVEAILKSQSKLYLALSGGGSGAISTLLQNGGASNVFLGAVVPYCREELEWLVGPHSKAVDTSISEALARTPVWRTVSDYKDIVSVGVTCSLQKSEEEREGREHIICLSVVVFSESEPTGKIKESIVVKLLEKRDRKSEEDIVSRLILCYADQYLNLNKSHLLQNSTTIKWIGLTKTEVKEIRDKYELQDKKD